MERSVAIEETWDGAPAREDEIARVEFALDRERLLIRVDSAFHGDPAPRQPAGRCDRLWEHEVLELFLVGANERYLEIELGPHGHYLALMLLGQRCIVDSSIEVRFDAVIDRNRWHGTAEVAARYVPGALSRWNAFAVHGTGAARRYLAAHAIPGPAPDFHRIDRFPEI